MLRSAATFPKEMPIQANIFRRISRMQNLQQLSAQRSCDCKLMFPNKTSEKLPSDKAFRRRFRLIPTENLRERLVSVLPSLDTQSRTLTVEAEIENVNGLLKPGQFATVRITQSKPEPAVMIPASAVRADGERNLVFVIKDGIANERVVQTGLLENNVIEIKQAFRKTKLSQRSMWIS